MKRHILQIAYNDALLATRAMMLEEAGYSVTSILWNHSADTLTDSVLDAADLVVIGFSESYEQRCRSLHLLKSKRPATPVVVLQRHDFEKFPEADAATLSENPETWLAAVARCLNVS